MSNPESPIQESPTAPPAPFVLPDEITKHTLRRLVWLGLNKARLINAPRPCWAFIPNFIGSAEAAEKLCELDEFKNAKVVKVNPDKPQESVRASVLKNKKELVIPTPRFKEGFLRSIVLPEDAPETDIKKASIYKEMLEFSKPIDPETKLDIDLVVVGSVAVSKEGYRVGKGERYADLEFATMMHLKSVKPETIIVTTVHDNQVFDSFPSEIFKEFDVPVDIIVTPTQVIRVEKRLPKPTGLIWSILTQRRLDSIPVLQKIREADEAAGVDVTLKPEESEEERPKKYRRQIFYNYSRSNRMRSRKPRSKVKSETQEEGAAGEEDRPKSKRNPRRRNRPAKKDGSGEPAENGVEDKSKKDNAKPKKAKKKSNRKRNSIDFSLRVGNIDRSVTVRDLKAALSECGVKPNDISWAGFKGFCLLHFSKPNSAKTSNDDGENTTPATSSSRDNNSMGVDDILESLKDLKLTPIVEKKLVIEPAKRISRIETTDVTTV